MHSRSALDLIGAFELRARLVPIQAREKAVIIVRTLVVRKIPAMQIFEGGSYCESEMACEILSNLTAAVGDSIHQQHTRGLHGAAGKDESPATDHLARPIGFD